MALLEESADTCTATTTFGENIYQSLTEPNTSSEYMNLSEANAKIKYEVVNPPARNLPPPQAPLPEPLPQLYKDSSPPLPPPPQLHEESESEGLHNMSSQQKLPIRNYYKLAFVFACVIMAFFVLLSLASLAFVIFNMADIKMSNALLNNLTAKIKHLEETLQAQLEINVDSLSSEINFLKNTTTGQVNSIVADLAGLKSNLRSVNLYSGCFLDAQECSVRYQVNEWYTCTTDSLSSTRSVSQMKCTSVVYVDYQGVHVQSLDNYYDIHS